MQSTYVDTETTGLDPRNTLLRIVTVNGRAFDVWDDIQKEEAAEMLADGVHKTFVAHNAQFDLDFLAEHMGYEHQGPVFDTMVAYQVLTCGMRVNGKPKSAGLGNVAREVLGVEMDKSFQKYRWDGHIDADMYRYAEEDTRILFNLHKALEKGLRNSNLYKIFQLEMKLLPVLLHSKRRGIYVDRKTAENLVRSLRVEAKQLEGKLPYVEVPRSEAPNFGRDSQVGLFQVEETLKQERLNVRSPAMVSRYFGIEDAQEDTLRAFELQTGNEVASDVRRIKKLGKKASSLKKQILDRIAYDGRIHPSFHQTFTETGRLSSREPNLQNQDRSDDVRGLFMPAPGNKFVIADYSQLELRLAAYFSGDETMVQAYRAGEADLHTETQHRIFGKPTSKAEDKKTRTLSKNINFGLVFGGGHNTLIKFAFKQGVIISEADAIQYRDAFRATYPGLYEWQKREGNTKPESVRTALGRRRFITPGDGYCTRINNKVQGSAADGMKLAMVLLFHEHNIQPLLNVHDEVVIECMEDEAEWAAQTVSEVMANAMYRATKMDALNPRVPIRAEVEVANSWADK